MDTKTIQPRRNIFNMEMQFSEDFKSFSLYICPMITMIAVVLTLIIAIHINRDLLLDTLIGPRRMDMHGYSPRQGGFSYTDQEF